MLYPKKVGVEFKFKRSSVYTNLTKTTSLCLVINWANYCTVGWQAQNT